MSTINAIGSFFKAYRLGRHITLAEAAKGFSPATLSRFERGLTDLSAAKAQTVIYQLGLEPQDFLPWLTANPTIFPFMARPLIETQNRAELQRRQAAFATAHPKTSGLTTLAAAWFPAALNWADPDFHLTASAEQRLADFMIVPENLTPLEEGLRSALIGPASHEFLTMLWTRSRRMSANLRKQYRAVVLIDYWLAAAASGDAAFLREHEADIQAEFKQYGQHQAYKEGLPRWRFAQLLGQWVMHPSTASAKAVVDDLNAFTAVGQQATAHYYSAIWQRAQAAAPSHHPNLTDHFGTLKTSADAGGVLARRLRLFGITAGDLPIAQDNGTFRRFMQGHTQPGFGALSQVSAELALLPQTLLTSAGVQASGGGHDYSIYSWWYELTDATDPEAAKAWYGRFAASMDTLPPAVQRTQTFIMQSALARQFRVPPTLALGTLASAQLTQLRQTNQWGVQEALTIKYLPDWLPNATLPALLGRVRRFLRAHPDDINAGLYHEATAAILQRLVEAGLATASLDRLAMQPLDASTPAVWEELGMVTALRERLGLVPAGALQTFADQARLSGNDWALDKLQTLLGKRPELTHPAWPDLY